ncbi:MAG: hypothetical protein Q7W51_02700 [Coriobacteriia bacterium]|nr:hypothetical protein [Coriobacteriia bacterium]
MASAEEYDRVLLKAELRGAAALTAQEKELLKRLLSESGARGNRARKLVNG